MEEKEVPGSEEVEEAEEILGLRQSGVKQETLDGVVHKPNYRKVWKIHAASNCRYTISNMFVHLVNSFNFGLYGKFYFFLKV